MRVPRGLLGLSLVFWGWQTDQPLLGIVMALAVEGARLLPSRLALEAPELARIADVTAVILLGVSGTLLAARGATEAVFGLFRWLPLVLMPLLLAQCLSADRRLPLSTLLRSLRHRKARDPAASDPLVDASPAYLVFCVLGAGAANTRGDAFYAGLVAIVTWALLAQRAGRGRLVDGAAMLMVAGLLGYAAQAGLARLQAEVEHWVTDWQLRGMDADPYRSATDIGTIGRLKHSDAIVLRVQGHPAAGAPPRRLHRASFTTYAGTSWRARNAPLEALAPESDGTTWLLGPASPEATVQIATRLERGKALLAMPLGTMRLAALPAAEVKRNSLGAVQADVGGDWATYMAEFAQAGSAHASPGLDDLAVTPVEQGVLRQVVDELGLRGLPVHEVMDRLKGHLAGFSYATFRESPPPSGTTALAEFLLQTRRGHCEYFATATALLLREAGVPTRYAVGFAVLEYSTLERTYVVRARHAHAWTLVWNGDRWVELDTTPSSWFAEEAEAAPLWQPLADIARWIAYSWSQRGEWNAGGWGHAVSALLLIALAGWMLLRARRPAHRPSSPSSNVTTQRPGLDSEFFQVEAALTGRGIAAREPGEALGPWCARAVSKLAAATADQVLETMALHQRYRFDPRGLEPKERRALAAHSAVLNRMLADAVALSPSGGRSPGTTQSDARDQCRNGQTIGNGSSSPPG